MDNTRPKLPTAAHFIEKLENMRHGIMMHMGEPSNEHSAVSNLVHVFKNGLLHRSRSTGTPPEFYDALARFFMLDTPEEKTFILRCLDQAIERMKLLGNEERLLKGNLSDALIKSRFGGHPTIKYIIGYYRPWNWKTPKQMEEKASYERLARMLHDTGLRQDD
jgi:hypothetical protein